MPVKTWDEFLRDDSLFDNAIRLRYFIWTINRRFKPGSNVLEVGCGSGTTSVMLADQGYNVTAVDVNKSLIDRIQERYRGGLSGSLNVMHHDMFALPWESLSFDLTIHQGVLEHFDDQSIVRALQEQGRVSRWIIFDVPNQRKQTKPFGDERFLSFPHWQSLIHQAGLTIDAYYGRDFSRWTYIMPHGLFTRFGLERLSSFGRAFGQSYVFVCKSGE